MKFLSQLPSAAQGALLIIAGVILFLDSLGYVTQILHTIVLCAAAGLIIWGIITADIVGKLYRLLKKDNQPKPPLQ